MKKNICIYAFSTIFIINCILFIYYFYLNKKKDVESFISQLSYYSDSDEIWLEDNIVIKDKIEKENQIFEVINNELKKITKTEQIFPKTNSKENKKELDSIKKKQKKKRLTRTKLDEINKQEVNLISLILLFTKNQKVIEKIVKKIKNSIDPIIMNLKYKFNRIRPYKIDEELNNKKIKMNKKDAGSPSFPSRIAVKSYYIAYNLSRIFPKNKNKYMEIAKNISDNREFIGFNFKSDILYGKRIGRILANEIRIS